MREEGERGEGKGEKKEEGKKKDGKMKQGRRGPGKEESRKKRKERETQRKGSHDIFVRIISLSEDIPETSPVVQWLRLHHLVQGYGFDLLVRGPYDPTCLAAKEPKL